MIGVGTVVGELRSPRVTPAAKHCVPLVQAVPRSTSSSPLPGTVETDHPDVAALPVLASTTVSRPLKSNANTARIELSVAPCHGPWAAAVSRSRDGLRFVIYIIVAGRCVYGMDTQIVGVGATSCEVGGATADGPPCPRRTRVHWSPGDRRVVSRPGNYGPANSASTRRRLGNPSLRFTGRAIAQNPNGPHCPCHRPPRAQRADSLVALARYPIRRHTVGYRFT